MIRRRGTGSINPHGYIIHKKGKIQKMEHVIVAEKVLGKPLPKGTEIHHIDGNKKNNDTRNLVVCPTHAYHSLLHMRTRALETCNHPDWIKCKFCKKYDDPKNLYVCPNDGANAWHTRCHNTWRSELKKGK